MEKRGYEANSLWRDAEYRGKKLGYISNDIDIIEAQNIYMESLTGKQITIYPEHNDEYLQECLDNLRSKGIEISLSEGSQFFVGNFAQNHLQKSTGRL